MSKSRHKFNQTFFVFILLGIISFLFVYFASYSTSPFYPYYYGGDSAQFQTIGKAWNNGLIPYVDMFDHKGPFIFFVDMLGFCLTDSSTGIMFLQIIFLFVTLLSFYKMTQLVSSSNIYCICAIIMSLCVIHFAYGEGNFVEEYCLPFIGMSTYFQIKYLTVTLGEEDNQPIHQPFHAFIYGISFGVCLLTKVTNGITIGVGTLLISCILFNGKKYKNLLWNVILFVTGFLLIFLPFAIYFGMHGAFYDFLYGTLLYNIKYQSQMSSWVKTATLYSVFTFMIDYFSAYVILIAAVLSLRRNKRVFAMYCFLCGILEGYLFTSGTNYAHYAIITLPQSILFLNEVYIMEIKTRVNLLIKIILTSLTIVFAIGCLSVLVSRVTKNHEEYKEYIDVGYEVLLDMIPADERNSFVAYGGNELKPLYLLHNLTPCYKYFIIQDWHARFSEETRDDIWQVFFYGNAKWILLENSSGVVQDVLDSRYTIVDKAGNYILYHLNDDAYYKE